MFQMKVKKEFDYENSASSDEVKATKKHPRMVNHAEIKANLITGNYKFSNKRGRSKVWNIFGRVVDNRQKEIDNVVVCRSCHSVFKFLRSTSNLVRHKCYRLTIQKHESNESLTPKKHEESIKCETEVIAQLIVDWAVENCRSFDLVNEVGFKKLAAEFIALGARLGSNAVVDIDKVIPTASAITQNIADLYELEFNDLLMEISSIRSNGYGLTLDLWTDTISNTSYASLNIHYIYNDTIVNRFLSLSTITNGDGNELRQELTECLLRLDCDMRSDKVIFVIDDDVINTTALGDSEVIISITNLLSNVVEKAVNEIEEVKIILSYCQELLKILQTNGSNFHSSSSHPNFIYSTCANLNAVDENWHEIGNILIQRNEIDRIKDINVDVIREVAQVLSQFEDASKVLEQDTLPTLHLVIPHVHKLQKVCQSNSSSSDSEILRKFKSSLRNFIASIVLTNITLYHRIALFLFPPTNKLLQFEQSEKSETINQCKSIMKKFCTDVNEEVEPEPPSHLKDDLFADFVSSFIPDTQNDKIDREIQRYLNMQINFNSEFNVIQWWKANEDFLPLLYKTSCFILGIPASNASSRKVFSLARHLICAQDVNSPFSENMINEILFLHNNSLKLLHRRV